MSWFRVSLLVDALEITVATIVSAIATKNMPLKEAILVSILISLAIHLVVHLLATRNHTREKTQTED